LVLLLPWQVDVPQDRYPIVNWLLIASILLVFIVQLAVFMEYARQELPPDATQQESLPGPVDQFVLRGWDIRGLIGHMWLHGGLLHIIGNLLFLWIFGNAVCAKIGNLKFLPIYIGLGIFAAISHLIFNGGPMIGASGAINGLVGMYLVFYPENDITCYFILWLAIYPVVREIVISSYWMILLWFTFDALGALFCGSQMGGVAYFAHVGGFLAGVAVAIVLLKTGVVVMEPRYEKSLLQVFAERKAPTEPVPDHRYRNFERDMEFAKQLEFKPLTSLETPPVEKPSVEKPSAPLEERKIKIDGAAEEGFIRFKCLCGKKVKIPAKYAGKTGKCPACNARLKIPYPSSS